MDTIRGGGGGGGGASPSVHLRSGQHLTKGAMQTVRWGSYDVPCPLEPWKMEEWNPGIPCK